MLLEDISFDISWKIRLHFLEMLIFWNNIIVRCPRKSESSLTCVEYTKHAKILKLLVPLFL
jgi:hypothetical protein